MSEYTELAGAMAQAGNLFLIATLPELRRQGLTYTAFYALQRTIQLRACTLATLKEETGLPDYEISRACKFLLLSKLVTKGKLERDRRVPYFESTRRGIEIQKKILQAAGRILRAGIDYGDDERRLSKATEAFWQADHILLGPYQQPFFENELFDRTVSGRPKASKRRAKARTATNKGRKP